MTLIALLGTIAVMAIGASAAVMGDALAGIILFLLPIGYWAIVLIRGQRKKIDEAFAARLRQHEEDYEKMKEAHRVRAEAEYARAVRNSAQQQANMARANYDRQRALAAQQQSQYNGFGFLDPRAAFNAQQPQSNFLSDTVNALMMQQMMNSGTVVTKSHYDHDTDTMVTKVIPTESVYREPDPEPQRSYSSDTSSSSSSSSDTSSDSFGGSDTSSDSF